MSEREWVDKVRRLFDESFSFRWEQHLADLNTRLDLNDTMRLVMPSLCVTPAWFNGDIEALEPGRWVLVISLNPGVGKSEAGTAIHSDQRFTPQEYWDFWRRFNTSHWYTRFFRPLVRVAAGALGEEISSRQERSFATSRMLFIEICPYASRGFTLSPQQTAELAKSDPGFRIARDIRQLAIEEGRPALILVNGNQAVAMVGVIGSNLQWAMRSYGSASKPGKPLHHLQGWYSTTHGQIPIAGFPFLRTRRGFNSNRELDQLADHLRTLDIGR